MKKAFVLMLLSGIFTAGAAQAEEQSNKSFEVPVKVVTMHVTPTLANGCPRRQFDWPSTNIPLNHGNMHD
ncbi:hypothetical protein [Ralstonia insidiosa]|jgi:hypothetical protein|nr:hypothetical protein [Ralstonia insidiosa]MBA9939260.1 hypothetical protein [Ralstonia insidiosa]MBC9968032.1 hypothetical protein [Ralstonia insidiosa]MBX3904405.1 hypothetical protein [Ralstonia insidiosa]